MNSAQGNKPHTLKDPAPTARQGQFMAYIHQYSLVNGCAPAEADMQRYFQITPPSVHSMVHAGTAGLFSARAWAGAHYQLDGSAGILAPFATRPTLTPASYA